MIHAQMNGIVEQSDDDLAIRLTAPFAEMAGLAAGMRITVEAIHGGVIVRRVDRSKDSLEALLARFDPALHGGEAMAFSPYGREVFW
ncbi:PbsX family transcriptional regulator [Variovorax sp. DXTD-1]|uniref:AbrB/MazE/SpoVT family DNA-binding domain-containing protein n=1 Tax=Variovorax sp. DXTD-1 TaxID=2495592 RepID=UPI000F871D37|nr:PbsX family transcriptional regulator [Variovorax sp. DXTD-1]RST52340.1 PbsX family transcriptional regulator [Variovorax sp. DXTD-1]